MLTEANKAIARRLYAAFNARDLGVLDELIAPDFVDHHPAPGQGPGVEGLKHAWGQIWAQFPGIHIVEDDMLAEGDKVAARVTFQRLTAPGEEATTIGTMLELIRVRDGKVVDVWNMIRLG